MRVIGVGYRYEDDEGEKWDELVVGLATSGLGRVEELLAFVEYTVINKKQKKTL